MFVYLVHDLTANRSVRIVTDGDPTVHPCFFGHELSVETLGEAGRLLSLAK